MMQYRKLGRNCGEVSVLGYGCIRFPKKGSRIDTERADRQVKSAIEKGVNYFDTAYIYPGSEETLGKMNGRISLIGKYGDIRRSLDKSKQQLRKEWFKEEKHDTGN